MKTGRSFSISGGRGHSWRVEREGSLSPLPVRTRCCCFSAERHRFVEINSKHHVTFDKSDRGNNPSPSASSLTTTPSNTGRMTNQCNSSAAGREAEEKQAADDNTEAAYKDAGHCSRNTHNLLLGLTVMGRRGQSTDSAHNSTTTVCVCALLCAAALLVEFQIHFANYAKIGFFSHSPFLPRPLDQSEGRVRPCNSQHPLVSLC